jgi:hypothetical protein
MHVHYVYPDCQPHQQTETLMPRACAPCPFCLLSAFARLLHLRFCAYGLFIVGSVRIAVIPVVRIAYYLRFGSQQASGTMRFLLGNLAVQPVLIISLATSVLFCRAQTSSSLPVVTIFSGSAYSQQRACVQTVLVNIGPALDCPSYGGYLDSCWCRSDLLPIAFSYISSAALSYCSSNPPDLSSAVSLYSSYCSVEGSIAPAPASTTSGYSELSLDLYSLFYQKL